MMNKNSILNVQTSDQLESQYSPLVLAQTAKMMDIDAKIYYLGQELRILRPGEAEKIKPGGFPSVAEMIKKTTVINKIIKKYIIIRGGHC